MVEQLSMANEYNNESKGGCHPFAWLLSLIRGIRGPSYLITNDGGYDYGPAGESGRTRPISTNEGISDGAADYY